MENLMMTRKKEEADNIQVLIYSLRLVFMLEEPTAKDRIRGGNM